MDVFDLLARISLDTSEYEKSLNDAEGKTSKFGEGLKSGLGTAAKVGGAAVLALGTAVVGGGKALISGVQDVATYGDEIDKTSQKLGLSAEAYQKWDYVLQLAGTEMSSMTTGLKTLTNKIDDAKNGSEDAQLMFAKLGISMDDLASMSREDIFAATIYGFQQMEDSTERAALANDLYGKSGQNLTPLFNQTAEATAEQIALAEKYGMVMGDDMVKSAAAFQDAMTTAQKTVTGLKNKFLGELLPSFTKVIDGFAALVSGTDETGEQLADGIGESVESITNMLPRFLKVGGKIIMSVVKGISQNLPEIVSSAQEMLSTFINGFLDFLPQLLDMAPQIFQNVLDLIVDVVQQVVNALPQIIQTIADVLPDMIRMLAVALPEIIDAILSALPDIIVAICDALPDIIIAIIEVLPTLIADIAKAVLENFPAIILAVIEGLGMIIVELVSWFLQVIGVVDEEGDGIWNNVVEWFTNLISNIGEWFSNIFNSIGEFFSNIFNSIGEFFVNTAVKFVNWQNETKAKIANFFSNLINSVGTFFSNIWNSITSWFSRMVNKVVTFVTEIPQKIAQGFNGVKEAGLNLVRGLWNGISDAAGWVLDKIRGFGQSILNGIKSIFGIHSPSREMAWVGKMLDEGLAGGIDKYADLAIDSAEALSDGINDAVDVGGNIDMSTSDYGKSGNSFSFVVNVYGEVGQDVNDLADRVSERIQHLINMTEASYA